MRVLQVHDQLQPSTVITRLQVWTCVAHTWCLLPSA